MNEIEYPAVVTCPLVDSVIDAGDCVVTVDCADGLIAEIVTERRFIQKKDWRDICKNCENRKYQD